jgi:tetratricopeptide (TPR) repeat protein
MSSDEGSAEAWLARGIKAYLERRFTEAIEDFERAVAIHSESVDVHLALGATYLTLYKKCPSPPIPNDLDEKFDVWEKKLRAYEEQEKSILAELNSTTWPLAEESLKRANQLDPQNKLVMEYLCALYFGWKDSPDEDKDRLEEAKHWFERLAEIYPEHEYANFQCGMIAMIQAQKLLPNYGRFPRPLETEEDRKSLRMKAGPLLEQAKRHLSQAMTLDPEHTGALHLMRDVKSMEDYLAGSDEAPWIFKELREKLNQATEDPGESSSSASITFSPTPEALAEARARPFPPNPWWI